MSGHNHTSSRGLKRQIPDIDFGWIHIYLTKRENDPRTLRKFQFKRKSTIEKKQVLSFGVKREHFLTKREHSKWQNSAIFLDGSEKFYTRFIF